MRVSKLAVSAIVASTFLAGCDSTTPSVFDDATVTADLAASAGDAMALSVADMVANEGFAGLAVASADGGPANAVTTTRTRTCFDAAGAVVANCTPLSSVRKVAVHVTIDGTRDGTRSTTGGTDATWTGAVHRVFDDTLTRNFNTAQPPAEVSRTHSGVTTGNDTTTFTEGTFTRKASESIRDTVKAVTFNLPRSSNPWPASGSIVRVTTVKVTVTKGDRSESRDLTRRITVTFPPDAQDNVVLTINEMTCSLNLQTRKVSNCVRP